MNSDFRIQTSFPTHPKTLALLSGSGPHPGWSLLTLWAWAAVHRPNGDLSGLDDRTIERAAGWYGEDAEFMRRACDAHFIDGPSGSRKLHDWDEWNWWASDAEARSKAARHASKARWGKRLMRAASDPQSGAHSEGQSGAQSPSRLVSSRLVPKEETTTRARQARAKPGGAAPETPGSPSGGVTNSEQPDAPSPPPAIGGTNGLPDFATQSLAVAYAAAHGLCRFCVGMLGKATPAVAAGCCYKHRGVAGPGNAHLFVDLAPRAASDPVARETVPDISDAEVLP